LAAARRRDVTREFYQQPCNGGRPDKLARQAAVAVRVVLFFAWSVLRRQQRIDHLEAGEQ